MLTLSVSGFERALATTRNASRQLSFALAGAINDTLVSTQKATVRDLLPSRLTLRARGRPWHEPGGPFGVNVRPFAKRTDAEPTGTMGTRAGWLGLQETGGTKTSRSGRKLAIPDEGTARPSPSSVVPRRNKPARILARRGFFVVRARSGRSLILERRKGSETRLWYGFQATARIEPRLGFGPFVTAHASRIIGPTFTKRLTAALSTAK